MGSSHSDGDPAKRESEIEKVIEEIVAASGGDDLLESIFSVLSLREREILWGLLRRTDAHELGYALGIEKQTVHNELAIIKEKLGIDSRPELVRRLFSALLARAKKS
jgi:DNA-binding CsgD family transcriptional regulator